MGLRSRRLVAIGYAATAFDVGCSLVVPTGDLSAGGSGPSLIDGAAPGDAELDAPGADGGADAPGDAHIDTAGFHFRRRIQVANGGTDPLPTGTTLSLSFDGFGAAVASGSARSDAADVRVVLDPGAREVARLVEPNGAGATVWFALAAAVPPGATDSSYALFYGDPQAASPSADGTKVFPLYDDFDGVTLSPAWVANGGPSVGGGSLTLHRNSRDGILHFDTNDGIPATSVFEARVTVTDPASASGFNDFWYWFGYQRTGDFVEGSPWSLFVARSASTIRAELSEAYADGGRPCELSRCDGPDLSQTAAMRTYRIERGPADTRYDVDGVQVAVLSEPPNDYAVVFRNFAVTSDLVVDWVRARALVTPAPAVTLGPEEKLF